MKSKWDTTEQTADEEEVSKETTPKEADQHICEGIETNSADSETEVRSPNRDLKPSESLREGWDRTGGEEVEPLLQGRRARDSRKQGPKSNPILDSSTHFHR